MERIADKPLAGTQAPEYRFDPPHCNITFMVRHIFVDVPGRFGEFGGVVRFDPRNLDGSLFDVTVKAASLDTFVEQRNEHLRSADFFEVATYPDIRFKSSKITHQSGNVYLLKGTLTLKDVSREVELSLTALGAKDNPMDPGQEVAGFSTRMDVSMPDYSFCDPKWSVMGVIGQHAVLDINLELLKDR